MRQSITDLAMELERQKTTRMDVVVDSREITAVTHDNELQLEFPVPLGSGDMVTAFRMTPWTHGQISAKTGIPKKYYDRLMDGHQGLLADNINEWMLEKEQRLVRILDGNVRAFLSDRYKILDNHDLLYQSLDAFKEAGAQIHQADLTETNMYVKAIIPHTIEKIREGDSVVPGLILRNSEVGAGAFKVEPFMLRLVCTNGMIGESSIDKIHLGGKKEAGIVEWSEETKQAENSTIWLKVRDTIESTFNPETFSKWVDQVKRGADIPIEYPVIAIDNVVEQYNMTADIKGELLNHFMKGADVTQWGLANAVTRTARDLEDVNMQVELESIGGKLAIIGERELMKMIV